MPIVDAGAIGWTNSLRVTYATSSNPLSNAAVQAVGWTTGLTNSYVNATIATTSDWIVYGGEYDATVASGHDALQPKTPAQMRALELLRSFLTDQQKKCMDDCGSFRIVGSKGRRYRLFTGTAAANVWELDDAGLEVAKLCAHPTGVPLGDQLLAQKILIEADEDAFRAVAVEHWRRVAA